MRFFASCFALWIGILLAAPCSAQASDKAIGSFLKDGKLDLEAVVKHFEDLYRSDSSILEGSIFASQKY